MSDIFFNVIILSILSYTAYYDIKYSDIYVFVPFSIVLVSILHHFYFSIDFILSFLSCFFMFVIGLFLYLVGGMGLGDAFIFASMGFYLSSMSRSILFLYLSLISFIPFLIVYVFYLSRKYSKQNVRYRFTLNGFFREIDVDDLREGMVLASNRFWDGVTKKDIDQIRKKHSRVMIREGIPFAPSMFVSFFIMCLFNLA